MSCYLKTVPSLALIAAMALAFPALARDLIVVNGPIKAKDVKCRGCVDTRDLGGSAVTSGKLKNDAVTNSKISDGAVGTNEVQDGAVTTGKIADGAVTLDKLAFSADGNEIAPFRVLENPEDPVVCIGGDLVIRIDNSDFDDFVVTGILIRTSGVGAQQFVSLRIKSLEVNGFLTRTQTNNLVGPTGQQGALQSADLMGTLLVYAGDGPVPGGTFPHQIVANGFNEAPADIEVRLVCDFDSSEDFAITAVAISGWKYTDDIVTLEYFIDE